MSNGITLPALNVRAVSSAFSSFNTGGAPPMQSPAAVLVALHPRRLQHYAQGYWRAVAGAECNTVIELKPEH
ncbi:MAG: hypothetical protein ACTIBJ_22100, partial [Pseudomonas helleri]|uniref:hypothetical protein n=1 Tax=Pseudomonas helleri TaxID=1608996 RepID=UPI003F99F54E